MNEVIASQIIHEFDRVLQLDYPREIEQPAL